MADTISLSDFLKDFNTTIRNLNTTTATTIPSIKGAELAIKDSTEADNEKYELINKVLKDVYSIDISMIEILDVDSSDRFFIEIRYTSLDNIYRRIKLADYRKMLSKSEAEITDYFRDILEYLLGGVVTFNVDYETYNERLEEIIKKYENKDGYEKDIEEILKSNKSDKKDTLIILARICVAYAIKARDKYKYEYDTLGWRNFNNQKVFVYADRIYESYEKNGIIKLNLLPAICVNDNKQSISIIDINEENNGHIDYVNMIYDLMYYHTRYPAIIISAALSGVVRQLLELGNEAGININICGTSGCGKTTIENIALSMFGDYNTLLNNFLATDNAINIGRVNKGFMPYVMDEQALKLNNMSENKKKQEALIQIFRVYNNTIKDTLRTNKYKGKISYGAYISSSVESIFDTIDETDLGQFRRLIELKVSDDDLFPDKETVEKYEEIIETNKGLFLQEFVVSIICKIKTDKNSIKNRYNEIRQAINIYYNKYLDNLEKIKENNNTTDTNEAIFKKLKAEFENDNARINNKEEALRTVERLVRNLKQVVKLDKKIALLLLTEELINETLDKLLNKNNSFREDIGKAYIISKLKSDILYSIEEKEEYKRLGLKKISIYEKGTLKVLENDILDMQLSLEGVSKKKGKDTDTIFQIREELRNLLPDIAGFKLTIPIIVKTLDTEKRVEKECTITLGKDVDTIGTGYWFYRLSNERNKKEKPTKLIENLYSHALRIAKYIVYCAIQNVEGYKYTDGETIRDTIENNYKKIENITISDKESRLYCAAEKISKAKNSDSIILYESNRVFLCLSEEEFETIKIEKEKGDK